MPFINPYKLKLSDWIHRIFSYPGFPEPKADLRLEFKAAIQGYKGIIVEIGSGSGQHLIELAKRNPQSAVIGFEIRYKRSVRTLEKAKLLNLNNIFILRGNAKYISCFFEAESIDKIYINFPDPWEKNSGRKNRIISDNFLIELHKLLKAEGQLSHKSDHLEYFRDSLNKIRALSQFKILEVSEDLHSSLYKENNILTEFEQLFLSQNLPINYLLASKTQ